MIVLDTDHISVLQRESPAGDRFQRRLVESGESIFTTAITLEEQTKSWISMIGRQSDVAQQVPWYERLVEMFDFFAEWQVLAFDDSAAEEFKRLRGERVRVASTDLKIASIALATNALLLTANSRDFERVPNLHFECWI